MTGHTILVAVFASLQRFEQQTNNRRHSTKIDTYVRFPLLLDMKAFTSPSIVG
jgi:hypothetical protein